MYMQERQTEREASESGGLAIGVIALAAVATVALGLYWSPLIDFAERATFFFSAG
jgi:NADH:ubiquinone oxidoreductase subunit 2 (subunit N)